jgi:hypothetical protein
MNWVENKSQKGKNQSFKTTKRQTASNRGDFNISESCPKDLAISEVIFPADSLDCLLEDHRK